MKLTELQLSQVDAQIKRLIRTDSYYGKIYKEAGITGVSSQEEFRAASVLQQGRTSKCLSAWNPGGTG